MIDKKIIIDSKISNNNVNLFRDVRIINSQISSGATIGDDSRITDSWIGERVEIARRNNIQYSRIDNGTQTGENTVIQGANIGKYCAISWNVTIGGGNHHISHLALTENFRIFPDETRETNPFLSKELHVGNDVWIAAGVHVLRGIHVSDGAICGAGAVVTKNVPPYAIVAGVPAKIIGYRFPFDQIERLKKIAWWDFPDDILSKCRFCFEGDLSLDKLSYLEEVKGEIIGEKNSII